MLRSLSLLRQLFQDKVAPVALNTGRRRPGSRAHKNTTARARGDDAPRSRSTIRWDTTRQKDRELLNRGFPCRTNRWFVPRVATRNHGDVIARDERREPAPTMLARRRLPRICEPSRAGARRLGSARFDSARLGSTRFDSARFGAKGSPRNARTSVPPCRRPIACRLRALMRTARRPVCLYRVIHKYDYYYYSQLREIIPGRGMSEDPV